MRTLPTLARPVLRHAVPYTSDNLCMLPLCLRYPLCFLPEYGAHQAANNPIHNQIRYDTFPRVANFISGTYCLPSSGSMKAVYKFKTLATHATFIQSPKVDSTIKMINHGTSKSTSIFPNSRTVPCYCLSRTGCIYPRNTLPSLHRPSTCPHSTRTLCFHLSNNSFLKEKYHCIKNQGELLRKIFRAESLVFNFSPVNEM